jgi:hypothetical protein
MLYSINSILPLLTGFRFKDKTVTEKYLETNHDGEWKHVSSDNWNWKETQVACRDLLDLE